MKTEQVWLVDQIYFMNQNPKLQNKVLHVSRACILRFWEVFFLKGPDYADKQIHSYLHCSILESSQ